MVAPRDAESGARGATVAPLTPLRPRILSRALRGSPGVATPGRCSEAVIVRVAGARVITFEQAVEAGCRYFARHGTLDLEQVAVDLAVSRATLYRVVSSRDRLLADVLWRLAQRSLDRAKARRTRDGVEGLLEVVRCFSRHMLASKSLRQFIAREPQTATRVLATPDGGVNRLAIAATIRLFDEVGLTGGPSPLAVLGLADREVVAPRLVEDPARVAYLLVRIVEAMCFAEVAGTTPDLDLTEQTIRALLVRACTPRQPRPNRFMEAAMYLAWSSLPDALLIESRLPLALAGL